MHPATKKDKGSTKTQSYYVTINRIFILFFMDVAWADLLFGLLVSRCK